MAATLHCATILFSILFVVCYEENTTNVFDVRDEQHKTIKYIAVLLFIIFLLYGIISNALMATVLFCKGCDNPYSNAFALIALQIVISNLMSFLLQLIVVLPEILQTTENLSVYQTTWINHTFATFIIFPFFALFHFSFLLTINRFVVLILPKYKNFFESKRLYYTIIFVWLSVLAVTICDFHYCTRKFLAWKLSWEENCLTSNGKGETWWRLSSIVILFFFFAFVRNFKFKIIELTNPSKIVKHQIIRYFWTLFIPNAMFALYVAIFYTIRHRRMRMNVLKTNRYEWLVLIQAAWNCGIMEIGIISFNFLPQILVQIFGEGINIASRIFINCYVILICAVFPTIHFIYCKKARNVIKRLLYRWSYLRMSNSKKIETHSLQ